MQKRIKVAYIFVLTIFFLSIDTPVIDLKGMLTRHLTTAVPQQIVCFQKEIPVDQDVLFFSNVDGTTDWNNLVKTYYQIQYWMVPRIIHAYKDGKIDLKQYNWFIAYDLSPEDLNHFLQQNGLVFVRTCDSGAIVMRIR